MDIPPPPSLIPPGNDLPPRGVYEVTRLTFSEDEEESRNDRETEEISQSVPSVYPYKLSEPV